MDEMALIATTNEIAVIYEKERKELARLNKRMKKGRLNNIIEGIKKKNGIRKDSIISKHLIRQRMKRGHIITVNRQGHTSPLAPVESKIVNTIVQMARIRMALSPSTAIRLVNSMIDNPPVQDNLINWKKLNNCHNISGTAGESYWKALKKRNKHLLVSKNGQKF